MDSEGDQAAEQGEEKHCSNARLFASSNVVLQSAPTCGETKEELQLKQKKPRTSNRFAQK